MRRSYWNFFFFWNDVTQAGYFSQYKWKINYLKNCCIHDCHLCPISLCLCILGCHSFSLIYIETYNRTSSFDVQCWLLIRAIYSHSSVVGAISNYYCSRAFYHVMNWTDTHTEYVFGECRPHKKRNGSFFQTVTDYHDLGRSSSRNHEIF